MRVTPNERWNGHWRQRGSGMRIGLRACRTLREQNFGMERRKNFGMTRVARAVQRNNASSSIVWSGWGGRTRTSAWRNQKPLPVSHRRIESAEEFAQKHALFHVAYCKEKPSVFNRRNLPQAARRDMVATWSRSIRQRQSRQGVSTRLSTISC